MVDPRIQFLILVAVGCLVMVADVQGLLLVILFSAGYLLMNRNVKKAIRLLLAGSLLFWGYQTVTVSSLTYGKTLGLLFFLLLRFLPILTIAGTLRQVPVGKLMLGLQQLRLPKNFVVTLLVAIRFFPLLKMENQAIQMSAGLRGLSYRQPRNWLRPFACFEYTFVPLMMRTLRIADELAAAGMTKGIDSPAQRTSIYRNRIALVDWLAVLGFCVCVVMVLGLKMR